MSDFYVIQQGAFYPQSYFVDLEKAEARAVQLKSERGGEWQVMDCDEWFRAKEESYLAKPAIETTEENFHEMLNVLPPMEWHHDGGVERFCMSEFTDGRITTQFARIGNRYFEKAVRFRDRSTYITPDLVRGIFNPDLVAIERHRLSVTQGEVTVSYAGRKLGRFGDSIGLLEHGWKAPKGAEDVSGWCGLGDAHWIEVASGIIERESAH